MKSPINAIVVSSKNAKEVLKSTRCLHQLYLYTVYWLTRPEYFDIVPDEPHVYKKLDVASVEAKLLLDNLDVRQVWVFDDDLRGRLIGLQMNKGRGVVFQGYSLTPGGREDNVLTEGDGLFGENYIFNVKGMVDDYIFHLIHKPLGPGKTYGTLGIYFGGGDAYKKLPFPEYNRIIRSLVERQLMSSIVLFGSEDNSIRANAVMHDNSDVLIVNAVGQIPKCNQLAHGFRECDVILSEDNFGMHLAIAVNQSVVGLFGHTDPDDTDDFANLWKVRTKCEASCVPCGDDTCNIDENCWNDFDIDEILAAIIKMNPKCG